MILCVQIYENRFGNVPSNRFMTHGAIKLSITTIYKPSENVNRTLMIVANYHDSSTGNYELKYD